MTTPDTLTIDFAGEILSATPGTSLVVGRTGDLVIDDNPYLHRTFLVFEHQDGLWCVTNVGTRLAAYVTDERGLLRSTLGPNARLPLVFEQSLVTFAAGNTLYELIVGVHTAPYAARPDLDRESAGDTTITPGDLTEMQRAALVALAERVLRRTGSGAGEIPTSAQAAQRLGWTVKTFDKKIENICDKLTAAGVRGLRAAPGGMASNRRMQLVEYVVSTLMVTSDDLPLLDRTAANVGGTSA